MATKIDSSEWLKDTRYYLLVLLVISLVAFWRLLFVNSYFGWGDARVFTRFDETWNDFVQLPTVWSTLGHGLGEIDLSLSQYPIYASFGLLTRLGLDSRLVSKLIFFIPSALLPTLGSFLLIRHFTRENLSAMVGSIVYSYNVYILSMQSTLQQISIAYSFAPLTLFMFIKSLEIKKLSLTLVTGIICFIVSAYEFRIFYIIAYVLLFYLIFHIFLIKREFHLRQIVRTSFHAVLPFMVVGALSAYWLLPLTQTASVYTNTIFSRPLFGDQYMSLKQSVAFFMPWWTGGNGYANGVVQPIPGYFWAIPVLALLGCVLNIKNPKTLFFLFLSVLGIILTKQSDKPFPNLYLWLYQHFPGFNAYREASKFYVILTLGYSGLISYFINAFRSRKSVSLILSILVSLLFLWNIKPLVSGKIGGIFIPKTRPRDFELVKDFIHRQEDFSRTAWLPAAGIWGYYSILHPKIDLHTVYFDTFWPIVSSWPDYTAVPNKSRLIGDVNHQVFDLFNQTPSDKLLDSLGIKYLIVPPEDQENDNNVFVNYGLPDRPYLISFLDSLKYLSRVEIGTESTVVYENSAYLPLISIDSRPLTYKRVDLSKYEISIPPQDKPSRLVFTNSYNPNWTLTIGKKTSPSEKYDELLNSFYLPPQIKTVKADLFFTPQKYVRYGSIMSLLSLAVITFFLTGTLWRKSHS